MKRISAILLFVLGAATATVVAWVATRGGVPRASGPMGSACYVWQRSWDDELKKAVRCAPAAVCGLAPLCAEMAWDENGRLAVAWPAMDMESLRAAGRPVSAILRIGPRVPSEALRKEVCSAAREVLARLRNGGVEPVELQVDFDCAASQLAGYRSWLAAIRGAVAPMPVRPTVLPNWLGNAQFAALAEESGGYILQVHATTKPRLDLPETALCEVADAQRWAEQAGRLGVPFRVALPTYAYRVAFSVDGSFLGIEAEGAPRAWPADAVIRIFRPDAAQMAALVDGWKKDRPACLTGLLWYRLPVSTDTQNWRWPTLAAVMDGRAPRKGLRVERSAASSDGAVDLVMVNAGEAEAQLPLRVVATSETAVEDADGAGGYSAEVAGNVASFTRPAELAMVRIPAGSRVSLGWVRTGGAVQFHIQEP